MLVLDGNKIKNDDNTSPPKESMIHAKSLQRVSSKLKFVKSIEKSEILSS